MIPSSFQKNISECYTCFVTSSDHKAVVLSLRAPSDGGRRRKHCPTSFLQHEEAVSNIAAKLNNIGTDGYAGWDDAMSLIRIEALAFDRNHVTIGFTEA